MDKCVWRCFYVYCLGLYNYYSSDVIYSINIDVDVTLMI